MSKQCGYCNDNLPEELEGVTVIYEDKEKDVFCHYGCFQKRMILTWEDEIQTIIKLEVEKL